MTKKSMRLAAGIAVALLVAGAINTVSAQATVEINAPASTEFNSTVDAVISISGNGSGVAPSGLNVRLGFDDSILTPTAIVPADGSYVVGLGPVEGTSPSNTVDVFISCPSNATIDPTLATVEFTPVSLTGGTDITIASDPDFTDPLVNIATQTLPSYPYFQLNVTSITPTYVNTGATGLQITVPASVDNWMILED